MRRAASTVLVLLLTIMAACTTPAKDAVVYRPDDPSGFKGAFLTDPYDLPDQTFTDSTGGDYNLRRTPSTPVVLLFFGYTHCPDVCVGVLSDVALALNRLPADQREKIQVLYVTTDPRRDTPEVMRTYLERFDPDFVGLTSSLGTIKAAADKVGVSIEGNTKLPSGGYDVAHSAQVIGFDKMRRGVVVWTPGTPIGDLKADFQLLVERQA